MKQKKVLLTIVSGEDLLAEGYIANQLVPVLAEKHVYNAIDKTWLCWRDNFWSVVSSQKMFTYINGMVHANCKKVNYGTSFIKAIIEALEGKTELQCNYFDEEYSTQFIPLKNGILDLDSRKLLPHSPSHKFRYVQPHDWELNASAPEFHKWLNKICKGDEEKKSFIQGICYGLLRGYLSTEKFNEIIRQLGADFEPFIEIGKAFVGYRKSGSKDHSF